MAPLVGEGVFRWCLKEGDVLAETGLRSLEVRGRSRTLELLEGWKATWGGACSWRSVGTGGGLGRQAEAGRGRTANHKAWRLGGHVVLRTELGPEDVAWTREGES